MSYIEREEVDVCRVKPAGLVSHNEEEGYSLSLRLFALTE